MTRALLIVDIQLDYFAGGAFPLVAPDAAAAAAADVLGRFRASGETVVHIFHVSTGADATFFRPGTPGIGIHPLVAPTGDEIVLEKHEPNSFIGTGLQELLVDEGVTELVVVGMMSSMCIDSTTRAASELGFEVTVVSDACTAPDLTFGDTVIPGATVHASFMAALDGSFATVLTSTELDRVSRRPVRRGTDHQVPAAASGIRCILRRCASNSGADAFSLHRMRAPAQATPASCGPPYDSTMTENKKTQDAPIMDGATEATEEEKEAGRRDHAQADAARDAGLDDDLRSIRAVDEGKTRPRTEGNGNGSDGAVDISNNSDS